MKPIRVLVVDDAVICREALRELLEAEGDIDGRGEASDGEQAVRQVKSLKPQVTTMDVQMPGLGGLDTIEQIMASTPVPILVITGRPANPKNDVALEAIRRGALDLIEKPSINDQEAGVKLRSLVRTFANVHVIKHIAGARKRLEPLAVTTTVALADVSMGAPFPLPALKVVGVGPLRVARQRSFRFSLGYHRTSMPLSLWFNTCRRVLRNPSVNTCFKTQGCRFESSGRK